VAHFPYYKISAESMTNSSSSSNKKQVLIRVPVAMYEDLLNLSAAATLLQRRSVSVPALVVEIVGEALAHRPMVSGSQSKIPRP